MNYKKFKEELQINTYNKLELQYQKLYKKNQEIEKLYNLTKDELYYKYKILHFKYQKLITQYNNLQYKIYNKCFVLKSKIIIIFKIININLKKFEAR